MPSAQRSFTDLGEPLIDTTFVVLDFETTGGNPSVDTITEIGAVRVRAGETLATFATLVNPGRAIPPTITVLTGITGAMVAKAPRIEAVLGSLVDFIGESVLVGHNVRFDLGFLQAALERDRRQPVTNRTIDTVALARRLVREEVPNCRLGTLAEWFRLPHQPSHRALDDALATADLLHVLLERAGAFGVTGLDDLSALPSLANHPQAAKLRLTERLPRRPGIYLFRGAKGNVLYVGKATDLRSRVRSYFSGDDRRKVGALLRETARIDHKVCSTLLEAEVLEARLIGHLTPPYNSRGTRWRKACYLRLTVQERFPRLSVVRDATDPTGILLGPLSSTKVAKDVADAIETVVPLRRCTARIGSVPHRSAPCAPAQLGVATCPCAGEVGEDDYARHVDTVLRAVGSAPRLLLDPLETQMAALAEAERYEEAATVRDRLRALSDALRRRQRQHALVEAERIVLGLPTGERVELRRGVLWRVWASPSAHQSPGHHTAGLWAHDRDLGDSHVVEMAPDHLPEPGVPIPKRLADELGCVISWLDRNAHRLRLEYASPALRSPLAQLPRYAPR